MTIGQRIAHKRKQLSLSQEALGETLGVSRQSIYKWESDTALPEVDKLISLSRLFGVSVGWLLGVEEAAPAPDREDAVPEAGGELSEAQLNMVKEIVAQYLAAQPKPKPRRKWPRVLLGFAVLIGVFTLIHRLDQIEQQYHRVQMAVSNVEASVDSQINGISHRVEEILKAQNQLTAEYGTEISGTDLAANQVCFSVYAVPKTYVKGMAVQFTADDHTGGIHSAPGEEGDNQKFSAALAAELTDSITLSATFIYPDGTYETQVLDTYEDLFSGSLPGLRIEDFHLFASEAPGGILTLNNVFVTTRSEGGGKALEGRSSEITEIRLGVFRNQKLLGWAAPCDQPENYHGDYTGEQFWLLPSLTIENLTETDKLAIAALVTDSYGRQFMACHIPYIVTFDTGLDAPYLTYSSDGRHDPDPENWSFEAP